MEDEKREIREAKLHKAEKGRRLWGKRLIFRSAITMTAFVVGLMMGWFMRGTTIRQLIDLSAIKAPEWVEQQFISVNPYSRPGTKLSVVNNIVIHYVANPGSTAQQNRDYFNGLKNQSGSNTTSVSSNFVVGLDGEIVQCIPVDEKAFASNERNKDTISIECTHPDESGEFTAETYESLVRLTAWLCDELDLTADDVIRHYDITGKSCPKAFVENEGEWKQFKKDVKKAIAKIS